MSLKKQFLNSRPVCKVTFTLESDLVDGGKKVALLGDFNNWDPSEADMRKLKDGSFTRTLELETGHHYQFRYLVDGSRWINDPEPDTLTHSTVPGQQNGVVEL